MDVRDELEIRNLIARVAWLTDTWSEPSDYIALYTEDCTWQVEGQQVYRGHTGIRQRMQEMLEQRVCGPGVPARHCVTSLEIIPDAERSDVAMARSIGLMMSMSPYGRPVPAIYGEKYDEVVKNAGVWKIRARLIKALAWSTEDSAT
ncbi:nuclear transport factor 2 family protein [Amycolatopsis acidicola]|nr:nuclear transport factor 2 family protein [Amycolatopsis acidicola]